MEAIEISVDTYPEIKTAWDNLVVLVTMCHPEDAEIFTKISKNTFELEYKDRNKLESEDKISYLKIIDHEKNAIIRYKAVAFQSKFSDKTVEKEINSRYDRLQKTLFYWAAIYSQNPTIIFSVETFDNVVRNKIGGTNIRLFGHVWTNNATND